jgi:glycosyltransferase involved in cell wall biosynthesis
MPPDRITVAYFLNAVTRAGVEEHVLTLLKGLPRAYFRLHLVCPQVLGDQLKPDLPPDITYWPLTWDRPWEVGPALKLARLLRRQQIAILHSHMFQAGMLASPLGWLCRVPIIIETSHGREAWRHGWLKGHFVIDRIVGRAVDHYIAVSQATAGYLIEQKGLPARKIAVIRSAADLSPYDPDRPAPEGLRRSLGFAEDDPVLVVSGRLEAQKGHQVLIEALPAVRGQFPRVRLVCLSDGSLRPRLERRARELELEEAVRFVGRQPAVAEWLALADVTVLPSFFEGLPLTAIESLAAGKPMVATAVDGTPEVVVDGQTGLTVPPGDPAALARAICRLLANPELRRQMGRAGRKLVLEQYSREKLLRDTTNLYLLACRRRFPAWDVPLADGVPALAELRPTSGELTAASASQNRLEG